MFCAALQVVPFFSCSLGFHNDSYIFDFILFSVWLVFCAFLWQCGWSKRCHFPRAYVYLSRWGLVRAERVSISVSGCCIRTSRRFFFFMLSWLFICVAAELQWALFEILVRLWQPSPGEARLTAGTSIYNVSFTVNKLAARRGNTCRDKQNLHYV